MWPDWCFKLDFKLDLLQMALNFMLLQDSCIRPIQVRSREIILFKTSLITKNETDFYIPIFLVFLTVRKFLSYINTGPDDFIYGRERKRLLINKLMLSDYPATHPVILSYNNLPCINHFQPPSRPLCPWKPNFKQRFHQIHSVHIVLQFNYGFTSTLRPKLWNPVSSEKRMGFRKFAQV